ncbi:MAG: vitamin K epoxide reductase family protein [Nocardioidaceae bacterium]
MIEVDESELPTNTRHDGASRGLSWLLAVGGAVGLVASFTLTYEKLELLENPDYVPSCNLNSVVSCGSVMAKEQASLFGVPNPVLGLIAFSIVVTLGVLLASRVRLPGWVWGGLQVGVVLGIAFVLWLAYESLYVIGALCPYCMVVWAVTWPVFFYVTLRNLRAFAPGAGITRFVGDWHALLLSLGYLVVVAAIVLEFGESLLG